MPKTDIDSESPTGCFQWVVTIGKAFDERWARARNAVTKRFRRREKTGVRHVHVPIIDMLNDTGTPALVFTKRPAPPQHQVEPTTLLQQCKSRHCPSPTPSRRSTTSAEVDAFVQNAIHNAMISLDAKSIQRKDTNSDVTDGPFEIVTANDAALHQAL